MKNQPKRAAAVFGAAVVASGSVTLAAFASPGSLPEHSGETRLYRGIL